MMNKMDAFDTAAVMCFLMNSTNIMFSLFIKPSALPCEMIITIPCVVWGQKEYGYTFIISSNWMFIKWESDNN